jgi:Tol biopolymer transport system component
MKTIAFLSCVLLSLVLGQATNTARPVGVFDDHRDIGATRLQGSAEFDQSRNVYTVTGGGENMWGSTDAFHFVFKRVTGDLSLAADINIASPAGAGTSGNPHRKAVLVIRQSLDADSPYADAALHGDGLSSLQYRETKAGPTREIQSNIRGAVRLQIEKRGDYVWMSLARPGEQLQSAGGSFRIRFTGNFYVGIGVCAHDNNVTEKAVFSSLELKQRPQPIIESTLETIAISSRDRKVIYTKREHFEAPNWSRDGKYLLFNQGGRIYKLDLSGGQPQAVDTGFANRNNNDHGISFDGTMLAISDQSQEQRRSLIYVVPVGGGTPRRVTQNAPSYWHGWSPDGKTLVYCGERNGNFDVYAISVDGGEERRLTTAEGLDDGPEYSPDGKYIYFNSVRSGLMQIWRMRPDGSEQTQVTSDSYNNWFAHPSPDGKWLVILTFEREVEGHPANKDVMLRIMPVGGGEMQVLAKLFGGQGTINVPSWSPDSKQLAFVSYRLIEP